MFPRIVGVRLANLAMQSGLLRWTLSIAVYFAIRMKISGHKTDSMERRYNITDLEDLKMAKELMGRRMGVTKTVTTPEKPGKLGDTPPKKNQQFKP